MRMKQLVGRMKMKQLVERMKMKHRVGRTNGFVLGGFLVVPTAANASIGPRGVEERTGQF
jgi:hypothetical protein